MTHFRSFELLVRGDELAEILGAEAWSRGAAGIEERRSDDGEPILIIYCDSDRAATLREELAALGGDDASAAPVVDIESVDWSEVWKEGFEAVAVSPRLSVRPSFAARLAPDEAAGREDLIIDPGQAFGTGTHASTRLALEWIDDLVGVGRDFGEASRVLDVGTGTGLLLIAGLRLGAGRGIGFDLDPVAVPEALRALEVNGVESRGAVFAGPIDALARTSAGEFDLVVVNMLKSETLPIAEEIARAVAKGGTLVLSGLLVTDAPEVVGRFESLGLEAGAAKGELDTTGDDWTSLRMVRPA